MSNVDLKELAIDRSGADSAGVRPPRHVISRYVLPLILIVGFLGLVGWASRDYVFPPQEVTVVPVFTSKTQMRQEGTPLFQAAGWIEPRPTPIRVAALAPGVVEELLVVEDQAVQAGDPVAELVKDDAELAHERALADMELREAELDEAKAAFAAAETRFKQPVHLEAALREAEASLAEISTRLKNLPFEIRRAEADHEAKKKDLDGKLAARGVVARIDVDTARSNADSARALVEELRDRAGSLKVQQTALQKRKEALKTRLELLADEIRARDEARAQMKAARARVAQAQVAADEAKLRLDRMTVRAPVDGRVFRLIAPPGTRIGSGMTHMEGHDGSTVVTMYQPDMLQGRVDVRFEDIPNVSLGQPVEINNPALSSPLTGSVLFISSEADIQKNTLEVKVAIPDPPSVFKPEMLVDATFLEGDETGEEPVEKVEKTLVPQRLIHTEGKKNWVWIADQSEQIARRQTVQISDSPAQEGFIEVTDGLTVSTRLIASGSAGLTDGARIRIRGEEPPEQ